MLIDIPEQWMTDPPSPASMRVWFAIASASAVMTIPEIMKRTGLNARTVGRSLESLAQGGQIIYQSGLGNRASNYSLVSDLLGAPVMERYVPNATDVCTKRDIPEPNDYKDLSGGMDESVHTKDEYDLFSGYRRARVKQTTINSTVKDLTNNNNYAVKNKRVPYKKIISVFESVIVEKYSHIQLGPREFVPTSMGGAFKGTLSASRLGMAIKREWGKHKKLEWFEDHFKKTLTDCLDVSDYHRGDNDDDWAASMFWLLSKKCQKKVREGQYLKQYKPKKNGTKTGDDFFPGEPDVIDIKAEEEGGNLWLV